MNGMAPTPRMTLKVALEEQGKLADELLASIRALEDRLGYLLPKKDQVPLPDKPGGAHDPNESPGVSLLCDQRAVLNLALSRIRYMIEEVQL